MDDMLLEDFVFLLMEDRRSFASEAEWVQACKGDPASLEVRKIRLFLRVYSHDHSSSYPIIRLPLQGVGRAGTALQRWQWQWFGQARS